MTEAAMIQSMIRRQRYHNGRDWPGKTLNAPAVTRYPNILAEIDASDMWLWCPAQHAGVSKEIMAAVLEDNEEMSTLEIFGLCRLYGRKAAYLSVPTLQTVIPATNRGKARRRTLADLFKRAAGLDFRQRQRVEAVLVSLNDGKPITYASWRWAVGELQDAIDRQECAQNKPRSVRMATQVMESAEEVVR